MANTLKLMHGPNVTVDVLITQAEVPLEFGDSNLTTRVISVNKEQLSSAVASGEFRSLSFQFSPNNTNSTVIHLISRHSNQVL